MRSWVRPSNAASCAAYLVSIWCHVSVLIWFVFCSVLFLNSDRSRHPPRLCCKALRFGSCTP